MMSLASRRWLPRRGVDLPVDLVVVVVFIHHGTIKNTEWKNPN
jgi:hypothetical protein